MTAPSPATHYDFSLWYSPEDDPIATHVSRILREQRFRGFVEHQDQVAGQPVVSSVSEVIQASRVAIVLVTPRSVGNAWCQRVTEWNIVHTIHSPNEAKVIPVYVGVSMEEAPLVLRHLHGLCYHEKYFEHKLLNSLKRSVSCRRTQGHSSGVRRGHI